MSFLAKLLPAKAPIDSKSIRAEIATAEAEVSSLQAKLSRSEDSIALLDDDQHVAVIETNSATRRAIARLQAKRAHLTDELPNVIAKEEAAAKAAADAALVKRAKAAVKANEHDAKALLESYAEHAEAIADILAKLKDMDSERESVNEALRINPVTDGVYGYNQIYRKAPDRQASERREMAPHWVYDEPARVKDEPMVDHPPTIIRATLDERGNPIKPRVVHYDRFGRPVQPRLENREVVVSRTNFRPGNYEFPLLPIHLPAAFAGQPNIWPRS